MKRLTPAEQVAELLVRVEEHRSDPRWFGWVDLMDRHLVDGPCQHPLLCPFCLVGRQPEPGQLGRVGT
jgi:hypothetical protein